MDPRQTTPPDGPDPGAPPPGGGDNGGMGWEFGEEARRPPGADLSAVYALLDTLRRLIPPELQDQFNALQREILLTVRALIDWYLERLDARTQRVQVEDIPIE